MRAGSQGEQKVDLNYESFDFEFVSNEYLPIFERWTKGEEREYIGIYIMNNKRNEIVGS